ncbi:MAG: hypothetical protein WCE44_12535 [Candidatus Velthaea sp.]
MIFTPDGGIIVRTVNGEQTRSVQNEAIQYFGKPLARSVAAFPGGPLSATRYL